MEKGSGPKTRLSLSLSLFACLRKQLSLLHYQLASARERERELNNFEARKFSFNSDSMAKLTLTIEPEMVRVNKALTTELLWTRTSSIRHQGFASVLLV